MEERREYLERIRMVSSVSQTSWLDNNMRWNRRPEVELGCLYCARLKEGEQV